MAEFETIVGVQRPPASLIIETGRQSTRNFMLLNTRLSLAEIKIWQM